VELCPDWAERSSNGSEDSFEAAGYGVYDDDKFGPEGYDDPWPLGTDSDPPLALGVCPDFVSDLDPPDGFPDGYAVAVVPNAGSNGSTRYAASPIIIGGTESSSFWILRLLQKNHARIPASSSDTTPAIMPPMTPPFGPELEGSELPELAGLLLLGPAGLVLVWGADVVELSTVVLAQCVNVLFALRAWSREMACRVYS